MPINTKTKALRLNNISKIKDISKWIEQDIIVPDSKPDAIKIVNVSVRPYLSDMELMQGKIKVVGNLNYYITYRVDDPTLSVRGLNMSFPFNEIVECKEAKPSLNANIKPICKNIIYSLPNERKIAIKSEIIFKTKIKNIQDLELISEFDKDSNIECKMCTNKFCNILQDKRSVITSKEEFMLPKEAEDFYEILNVDTKVINTEYKESYNKIMLKGDIEVKMIYLAENKDECIKRHTQIVPFSAMVELENINDRSKFDIEYLMQDFKIELNPDITTSKTMSVDYKLEVNVVMFEEEEVEYVEDFYSQTKQLECEEKSVNVVRSIDTFTKNLDVKENVNNILDENTKVIDSKLDISSVNIAFSNMQVDIQGQAKIQLLTMNTLSMEVENKTLDIIINESFNIETNIQNTNNQVNCIAQIIDSSLNITQSSQDIDVRITLKVKTQIEDIATIKVTKDISSCDVDESDLDSINIYIVKNEDTLWSIAKKYKTSVDKILQTNNIEESNNLQLGQKLLVIR